MSGIEAVIGLAAGGAGLVSLSIQLVECTIKLKRLYHAAQDAPRTISNLIFDLETTSLALQQLEQHRENSGPVDALLARCIIRCQQETTEIGRLVAKMEGCIARHSKIGGKIYSAFKQRDVEELLDSLEKSKSALTLAYMMYRDEHQRRRDEAHNGMLAIQSTMIQDLQAQMLAGNTMISNQLTLLNPMPMILQQQERCFVSMESSAVNPIPLPVNPARAGIDELNSDASGTFNYLSRGRARTKKSKTRFRATIRLPSWVSRRVYDIAVVQLQCGWCTMLQTYNELPGNPVVVRYCRSGNLAGLRNLIENRKATILDTYRGETLLEIAASAGQSEICRYLLNQGTFPDRGTILSKALTYFSLFDESRSMAPAMFRLFMNDPDFDADLTEGLRTRWLYYCGKQECLQIIMQSQDVDYISLSLQQRFELASRLPYLSIDSFLWFLGLQSTDPRLASLKTNSGVTVLDYVGFRMRWLGTYDELRECTDLGTIALLYGADPCSRSYTRVQHADWELPLEDANAPCPLHDLCEVLQKTPLLNWLGDMPRNFYSPKERLVKIRRWADMLQSAKIDLRECGAKEAAIWESLGYLDPRENFYFQGYLTAVELIYGAMPEDWSLRISHSWTIKEYRLQPPPGAFNLQSQVPPSIIWEPAEEETDEGPWTVVDNQIQFSRTWDIRYLDNYPPDPFEELVDRCQDDYSVIMLMEYRASRSRHASSRSHSQPPCLRRREMAYYTQHQSLTHPWMPVYHLCPADLRWKFQCAPKSEREVILEYALVFDVFDVRSCVKDSHIEHWSSQSRWGWRDRSFLAHITRCQDSRAYSGLRSGHHDRCPAPQACEKLHIDRLNVPEDLRAYHPQRYYYDYGDET